MSFQMPVLEEGTDSGIAWLYGIYAGGQETIVNRSVFILPKPG
jgi:hypothetical protein